MTKLEKTLYDLLLPLVDDKDNFSVAESDTKSNKTVYLNVTSDESDIARLIGRRGNMARSIRQTMLIAGRLENKKIMINFETREVA